MATETKRSSVKLKSGAPDGSSKGKVDSSAVKKKPPADSKMKSVSTVTKSEVKSRSTSSSSKTITKTTTKVREKKVYSLPGQKHDPPEQTEFFMIWLIGILAQLLSIWFLASYCISWRTGVLLLSEMTVVLVDYNNSFLSLSFVHLDVFKLVPEHSGPGLETLTQPPPRHLGFFEFCQRLSELTPPECSEVADRRLSELTPPECSEVADRPFRRELPPDRCLTRFHARFLSEKLAVAWGSRAAFQASVCDTVCTVGLTDPPSSCFDPF
uniref:Uncharacterized protein n=1 Tax=Cajanus cajan TaxID=3821 RepID=A0A151SBY1_CAJCA|nr:hypothetical protein KK1_025807 [Cajanus cajan]